MKYKEISQQIADKLKISNKIFNLINVEYSSINSIGLHKSCRYSLKNNYSKIKYEYSYHDIDGWKSITLFFPTKVFQIHLVDINKILSEFNEEIIDLSNNKKSYIYLDNYFAVLSVFIKPNLIEFHLADNSPFLLP